MITIKKIFFIIILVSISVASLAQENKGDLLKPLALSKMTEVLISPDEFQPVPKSGLNIGSISKEVKDSYINKAENYLGTDWETLPADIFLEFSRSGNRSNYESIYFERRRKLKTLVLGEYFENKGRFIDEIVNGVWLICEETSWVLPAHMYLQDDQSGLPDVKEPTVGLFASETSSLLAFTHYLFNDKFDEISSLISERIRYEINRKILTPNLEREDFWWMGYGKGRHGGQKLNNWTPWISSNWLISVLLLEEDPIRRAKAVNKIMYSLNKFINQYPEDGGSEEGPSYWGRNGASLFENLELLKIATKGQVDIFDEPIIRKIGEYIYKVHIGQDYYINFADGSATLNPNASIIYRYGEATENKNMINFAGFLAEQQSLNNKIDNSNLARTLFSFGTMDKLLSSMPGEAPYLKNMWLSKLQVMATRSTEGYPQGFYLAAKGGNNGESHNHNDVGNFIVYYDGKPIIVDPGVGTYTAKTFSSERYDIWTMNSDWHTLPTINGYNQLPGENYKAENVKYQKNNSGTSLVLDIADAYPKEAKIKKWKREIKLSEGEKIQLSENYELNDYSNPTILNFVTPLEVDVSTLGKISLKNKKGDTFFLTYENEKFTAEKEKKIISDKKLKSVWGGELYRIKLVSKNKGLTGDHLISIYNQNRD